MKTVKKQVEIKVEDLFSTDEQEGFKDFLRRQKVEDAGIGYIFGITNQFGRSLVGAGFPIFELDGDITVTTLVFNHKAAPSEMSPMTPHEIKTCWRHQEKNVILAIAERFKADFEAGLFEPKGEEDAEAAATSEELPSDERHGVDPEFNGLEPEAAPGN